MNQLLPLETFDCTLDMLDIAHNTTYWDLNIFSLQTTEQKKIKRKSQFEISTHQSIQR